MIELKEYTTSEFRAVTQVSKHHWETEKDKFLEYCKNYFEFETYKSGRIQYYRIFKIYQEWKPYPGKKDIEAITKFYKEETYRIVKAQPRNTGSNVVRILEKEDRNPFNHASSTMGNYIRPSLKNQFKNDESERAWCHLVGSVYELLTEEELNYLQNECFEKAPFSKKELMDKMADVTAGTVSKEEAGDIMVAYLTSPFEACMQKFKEKYGFRPIRVPLWYEAEIF